MFGVANNRALQGRTLVYLTQLNQALCMAAEISHFRRHSDILLPDGRGMNTGVMFWQLNDVWAAPTWSVLDVNLVGVYNLCKIKMCSFAKLIRRV